ncbi:ribosome-binding factor A [Blattabacterium cuenoti]|uniref:ribosome-binding factor A n=1 Tax=Blattabacterium cuenoti TaxID=1653831 RepID=UPI00163BE4AD|nr:ribosome-binding factor A [Blattabacterium cuenoti]
MNFIKNIKNIKNKKISSIFYTEIAEILNEETNNINIKQKNRTKFLITLIKVSINTNINIIKVYINIYPFFKKDILYFIRSKSNFYRKKLFKRLRYRINKIPKLDFCEIVKDQILKK